MLSVHAFFRVIIAATLLIITICAHSPTAYARARLIAVITFRSTPAARHDALVTSREIANRLAQEPGWDAIVINAGSKNPADAAAAVGAEDYVIGQYFPGPPPHVSGATYRVATDERLKDFDFDVSGSDEIPQSVTFPTMVPNGAAALTSQNPEAGNVSPQNSQTTVVPRGTIIVVAMDHLVNSYAAASREPLSYSVVQDVIVDGHFVAKAGDQATGMVLEAQQGNQGGLYGIGWKAANLRVDVEAVHNFCGDTIPMSFVRSEYRRRQGLFGAHQDLEIVKGQKYLASVAHTVKVCSKGTSSAPQPLPADALAPDDAPSVAHEVATPEIPAPSPTPRVQERATPAATPERATESEQRPVVSPPADWIPKDLKSASGDVKNIGFWMSPQQDETLGVIAQSLPAGMSAAQYVNLTLQSLRNSVGSQNVRTSPSDRICNGTMDGWYVESSVVVGFTPMIAEQTIAVASNQAYIATYRRPSSHSENPKARQSLYSLCPSAA